MLLTALCIFAPLLLPGRCLFSTDDNIGMSFAEKRIMPGAFVGWWGESPLLGYDGGLLSPAWVNAVHCLVPALWFTNWMHTVDLVLAAVFLMLFLRKSGVRSLASAIGAITVVWLGSNLTLIYAGHTPKFGVIMFCALALYALRNATSCQRGRGAWAVIAGGALGFMLLEQQDVATFFGMMAGGYLLLRAWRGRAAIGPVRLFAVIGAVALLIAGPTMVWSYITNVKQVAVMNPEDSTSKWEFVTQWSVPPDETIDLIAPHYFGIRSGEPEGPYWGRTGRSAGWEQTHQGFMNFRLESIYIGAIPVVLALFAVAAAVWSGKRQVADRGLPEPSTASDGLAVAWADRRAEILFFGGAALVALLLAYGKYVPLYALFYKLPVVNNIRNPNKFIQVFQMALGILAAYGLDTAMRWRCQERNEA